MTDEQAVVHHAAALLGGGVVQSLLRAGEVGLAVGEGVGAEQHTRPVRRHLVAGHIQCECRQLARRPADQWHRIQLLRAGLRAEEIDRLAIRRERRRVDVPPFRGQALRRRHVAGQQVADPQAAAGLDHVGIDDALGEDDRAAIRRQHRRGHAVQFLQVAHIQAAGGGERRQRRQQAERQQGGSEVHPGLRRQENPDVRR